MRHTPDTEAHVERLWKMVQAHSNGIGTQPVCEYACACLWGFVPCETGWSSNSLKDTQLSITTPAHDIILVIKGVFLNLYVLEV